MPLFWFYNIHTFHSIILHSSFAIRWSLSPFPHRLCAQWGKLPCGAEPRIELGPALQQADALPTEPSRTSTRERWEFWPNHTTYITGGDIPPLNSSHLRAKLLPFCSLSVHGPYTVKKVQEEVFPTSSGMSLTKLSLAGRVLLVTSRLGTGKPLT
jgi:hypothetical protein